MNLKKEKTEVYDKRRHAQQAPVRLPSEPREGGFRGAKYRVIYLDNGRERKSPWYYHHGSAERALELMAAKYGEKNAIIFVD